MIDLYAAGTSNGMRARIAVEECGFAYNFHPIDIQKGEHKLPGFLAMNPMGQIPVPVDNLSLYAGYARAKGAVPETCEGLPNLERWAKELGGRPAIQRATGG
jgi:glutathione S-transferase